MSVRGTTSAPGRKYLMHAYKLNAKTAEGRPGVSTMNGGNTILGAAGAASSDHPMNLVPLWRAALRGGRPGPVRPGSTATKGGSLKKGASRAPLIPPTRLTSGLRLLDTKVVVDGEYA